MKITTNWLFDNTRKLETKKAKWQYSKVGRFFLKILEIIQGEYFCDRCNMSLIVREIPGEFKDFDADDNQGGIGIPLCSGCLGTGKVKEAPEFQKLRKEVSGIRGYNLSLQINAAKIPDWKKQVQANNKRLIEIAKRGLELIKYPSKGCLARELAERK